MFEQSSLFRRWHGHVMEPPSNDFVIAITASGKSSMSRTGKTTLETFLAEKFDQSEDGFDAEKKATLDARDLHDIVANVEDKSAVCFDEAQGAAGTEGLDARRSMRQSSLDAINSILNNGDKMLTLIITAQHMPMLDIRIPPMVDSWCLIRHGPSSPKGPLAIDHAMYVEDYNFKSPQIKTPAYEDFAWPKVDESNPNYVTLERMKQDAKTKNTGDDEDKDLPKETQARIAQSHRDAGKSLRWIAENVEDVKFGKDWISRHTTEPVDSPEAQTA